MTGVRNKSIYGELNQNEINEVIFEHAKKLNIYCDFYQTNHEGVLIDKIQESIGKYDAIILNAGAYTHYSIAIRDAIEAISPLPVYEVHMSNINIREDFRKNSVIKDVCKEQIMGQGVGSYLLALDAIVRDFDE